MSTAQPAPEQAATTAPPARRLEPRDLLAFGSGVGVRVGAKDLEIVVVHVRPTGVKVAGGGVIERFRERPAAEWGAQYVSVLQACGAAHIAATVMLPRHEVIVRQIALPGVAPRDIEAAIGFQIDSLHPYGDEEVAHAWMRLGSSGSVLAGIVRRSVLDRYLDLFTGAGIGAASFTFSAGAMWAASRLLRTPDPNGFLAMARPDEDGLELYGESPTHPVFSAVFDEAPERAAALALAELRLGQETAPSTLAELLRAPTAAPPDFDLSRNALAYAAALAGACPRLAPAANLLPQERRVATSRMMFVPTAALAAILILVSIGAVGFARYRDASYLRKLEAEIALVEPAARRAQSLDVEIEKAHQRTRLLDEFRHRSKDDLDAIAELTHLLAPPIWTNSLEMNRDTVQISGEAEQAAALVRLVDDSALFENAQFVMPIARNANAEIFRLRLEREKRR